MMRQTDDAYLVGAATNESGREINLPLSFLGQGSYKAEIVEDGDQANYLTNRETIKISSKTVNNKESLHLKLAPGGGACLKFTKTKM